MYNYLVIFFSIFFLLSGCSFFHQDVQNGTKIEPEINIKAAKGDLSVFHLLKENWIKKANLDGLPNELSPDGKWVPVYDSKTGIADYLITTNSPSRTLPIQKISNLWQKSWLYWSPDGKSFAIIAGDISTVPWGDRVLIYHLVNEKLLSPKIYPLPFNLFTDQKLKNIAWAPDSTQLALLSEGPNKLYFIDQNANPIKELNVDNLQDNSDFALEWGKTGLFISIFNKDNFTLRKYNLHSSDFQTLFNLNTPTSLIELADFNMESSLLTYKIFNGGQSRDNLASPKSKSYELFLVNVLEKTTVKDIIFQDIDGRTSTNVISSSDAKWMAILGNATEFEENRPKHIYLFNQANFTLIDYGFVDKLIGWYPNENGFLVQRKVNNGESEIDVLSPPSLN